MSEEEARVRTAVRVWQERRERYEEVLGEGADDALPGATEAMHEAAYALERAARAASDRARALTQDLAAVRAALDAAIEGLRAVAEQQALDAERSAGHGELAGADAAARDELARLEAAQGALDRIADASADLLGALEP